MFSICIGVEGCACPISPPPLCLIFSLKSLFSFCFLFFKPIHSHFLARLFQTSTSLVLSPLPFLLINALPLPSPSVSTTSLVLPYFFLYSIVSLSLSSSLSVFLSLSLREKLSLCSSLSPRVPLYLLEFLIISLSSSLSP